MNKDKDIKLISNNKTIHQWPLKTLLKEWHKVSYEIQSLRDNPETAKSEYLYDIDSEREGIKPSLCFKIPSTFSISKTKPSLAILREQGINGQVEMAAAFDRVGFDCIDVHMTDLISGDSHLREFQGLVACGGFSFGDVPGAGQGWAKSILFEPMLRHQFEVFFAREEIFALGVCNGCQMMAALKDLIPGAKHWPHFGANRSGQFESRVIMVEVLPSDSVLFEGMAGTRIPVVVAHGEGRAQFAQDTLKTLRAGNQVSLRFVDNYGRTTDRYPFDPNGSTDGVTGLCAAEGRVTIMMPHPERNFRTVTNSWRPGDWGEHGPWLRMYQNARAFVS